MAIPNWLSWSMPQPVNLSGWTNRSCSSLNTRSTVDYLRRGSWRGLRPGLQTFQSLVAIRCIGAVRQDLQISLIVLSRLIGPVCFVEDLGQTVCGDSVIGFVQERVAVAPFRAAVVLFFEIIIANFDVFIRPMWIPGAQLIRVISTAEFIRNFTVRMVVYVPNRRAQIDNRRTA